MLTIIVFLLILAVFLILLLIALSPGVFLVWYFQHRDKYQPEPKKLIIRVYLLGALMVIPAFIVETILEPIFAATPHKILNAFLLSFILIAPTEELLKYIVVRKWVYNKTEFDEVMDGIVYCVASTLGFATVENILYVFNYGIGTGILRAFLSVPGHAFFGALMGYYLGRAKLNPPQEGRLIFLGIWWAILAHGFFDFLLLTRTVLVVLVVGFIIFLGFLTKRNLKRAELLSKTQSEACRSETNLSSTDPDQK